MDVEFVGQSARDNTAVTANSSRLLNLYREPVQDGGVTRHLLRAVPGMTQIADLGGAFLRRLAWIDGNVYAVRGGELYLIDATGGFGSVGAVLDDENTDISGNTGMVTICAGGRYYVWDGVTLSQPAAGAFSSFGSVATLNNYTLLTERNGRKIQWSGIADPKTLDGLDFATTESRDDKNIRGVVIGGQFWVFKERSIEVWYNTGLPGASAFARVGGGVIDTGLKSFGLICKARDGAFFVGSDNVVYLTEGSGLRPVSSRGVETALRKSTATSCFYYEQDGHKFCVLRFSDRPAWVFDIATTEWHERAQGKNFGPWSAVDAVEASNGVFWSGSTDGKISRLGPTLTDNGATLYRRAVSRTLRMDSERFRGKAFEMFGAYGFAEDQTLPAEYGGYALRFRSETDTTQTFSVEGLNPHLLLASSSQFLETYTLNPDTTRVISETADEVTANLAGINGFPAKETNLMVSFSRDGGVTWGDEYFVGMGKPGEYETRTVLRSLGQFRRMTVQVDIADEYGVPIYSTADLDLA